MVIAKLRPKMLPGAWKVYTPDRKYYCAPLDDIRTILQASQTSRRKWMPEKQDCDDFAKKVATDFIDDSYRNGKRRYPYAVGLLLGTELKEGPHAINIAVTNKRQIVFIEPQTDAIFNPRAEDAGIFLVLF